MAEPLKRAETPSLSQSATPESEQWRAPESTTPASTGVSDQSAKLSALHSTMGNAVVNRLVQDPQGASRPADPGQGPGLDVVFVLRSSAQDLPKQQEYIHDMTDFIRSALPGERLYEVDDLDGLLAGIFVIGANGERIRRLRIVGHGSHDKPKKPRYSTGGRVLIHDPGGRPMWIGADVVMAAARDPDNISMMQEVMTKDSVVEFWGCSLGGYAKSGRAWAALFQRPVAATAGHLMIDPWQYWMLFEAPTKRRNKAGEKEVIKRRALTSAEAYQHGPQVSHAFEEFLLSRYRSLVTSGQISSVGDDRNLIIAHMRQMFDAQQGAIHELTIPTPSGKVGPGQLKDWNRLWRIFEPRPIGAVVQSAGGHPRRSMPGARDVPGAVRRHLPAAVKQPHSVLSERAWAHSHPAGLVEQTGQGAWVFSNFDVGRSKLKKEYTRQLDAIAHAIGTATGTGTVTVSVDGYASASGPADLNRHLSIARAAQVAAYLRQRLGQEVVITAAGHGVRGPQALGGPEDSASNRRVEVRIVSLLRPPPPTREPLPPPHLEQPAGWHVVSPAREEHGKALADYLPGYSIEGKLSWQLATVPLGTDWLLIGEAEAGLKLEFTTRVPITAAMAMKNGKWDYQIKLKLAHSIAVTGSLTEGKIGVRFEDIPMITPELEVGVVNLLKDPSLFKQEIAKDPSKLFKVVSIKFNILKPLVWPREGPLDLGRGIPELAGIGMKLTVQPKAVISLAPSPALIARMAVSLGSRAGAAGPIAAGVIGGVGWTVLALYLIDRAHKRGERWAEVVNFRRAYARRLAAEAADWRPGRGIASAAGWREAREEMLAAQYHGRQPVTPAEAEGAALMERTYTEMYEGWQSAEAALRLLPVDQYDATMEALRKRFGTDFHPLLKAIFIRIGGASEDPIEPPANLNMPW
jgi:outer membrane protein OmpA-like peptidoglycan-associated protein